MIETRSEARNGTSRDANIVIVRKQTAPPHGRFRHCIVVVESLVGLERRERLGRRRLVFGDRQRRRRPLAVAVVRLLDRRLPCRLRRLGRLALSAAKLCATVRKPHLKQRPIITRLQIRRANHELGFVPRAIASYARAPLAPSYWDKGWRRTPSRAPSADPR